MIPGGAQSVRRQEDELQSVDEEFGNVDLESSRWNSNLLPNGLNFNKLCIIFSPPNSVFLSASEYNK